MVNDQQPTDRLTDNIVLQSENTDVYYGNFLAVKGVYVEIPRNKVTAFIGPSGCGKSTLLRCFNRLNDLIPVFKLGEGSKVTYLGQDLYAKDIDPVQVRRRIGMVFQRPNPFPKSIYENITYGAKINKIKTDYDALVEDSLRKAALWDEVKDKLRQSGLALSGGQQQRLCIARTIALKPDVVLMDEPCSALDPISTLKVEELIHELKENFTIVIVTHNMQQATRVADYTAFFNTKQLEGGNRQGYLAEFDRTEVIFNNPSKEETQQYISGRFG